MKQELIDRYPGDSLAVTIVWSPMMTTDNEKAARNAASALDSKRVKQYYDPHRLVGSVYRNEVFPDLYAKELASLPADHWLRESMPDWMADDATRPEWDIYMFFVPGVTWRDAPPQPTRFIRHLGRIVEHNGESLSLMWIDAYENPPVEGHLSDEIGRLGRELLHPHAIIPSGKY